MKKEIYEILRNGSVFGVFHQGDASRFDGKPFDREVALMEFDSCINHWNKKGDRHAEWTLRIRVPNNKMSLKKGAE